MGASRSPKRTTAQLISILRRISISTNWAVLFFTAALVTTVDVTSLIVENGPHQTPTLFLQLSNLGTIPLLSHSFVVIRVLTSSRQNEIVVVFESPAEKIALNFQSRLSDEVSSLLHRDVVSVLTLYRLPTTSRISPLLGSCQQRSLGARLAVKFKTRKYKGLGEIRRRTAVEEGKRARSKKGQVEWVFNKPLRLPVLHPGRIRRYRRYVAQYWRIMVIHG